MKSGPALLAALLYCAACLGCASWLCGSGVAANLRPYRELSGGVVRLSDLFDALGDTVDRDLGPSPAPGNRIIVQAPQLAAIARDFGVAWRPISGAERAILNRGGAPLPEQAVLLPLRAALLSTGAPAECDIDMPGFTSPIIPTGTAARAEITDVQFDAPTGRFSAQLAVSAPDIAISHILVSGHVIAVVHAAVLTRRLTPGTVLQPADIRTARLHADLLRGKTALTEDAVLGLSLRHDLPPGQPLTTADVARPLLVTRNSAVRMRLEAGGLQLAAQGIALEDGGLGDRVRVQNPSSHAVVAAEVTGDNEVRVEPSRPPVLAAAQ